MSQVKISKFNGQSIRVVLESGEDPSMMSKFNGQSIRVVLESGSVAELDRMDSLIEIMERDFNVTLSAPVYWFCRIKARVEGRGDGTTLMREVCRICDEGGFTIVNGLNPYGSMGLEDLIKFNEKFGFVHCGDSIMYRVPHGNQMS